MNNDPFLISVAIVLGAALVAGVAYALVKYSSCSGGDGPDPKNHEANVRIVELDNGKYALQEYDHVREEWLRPFIPVTVYDRLGDAQKAKADLVKSIAEEAGYRMKRVVD